MAQLGSFNPDAVPDDGGGNFDVVPAGWYVAQIIESDLVPTKTGSGQMLKLTFEIVEGPCTRRRVWENLNILNANAQAQEIAQRDLKRICGAIGHTGVLSDSEALHFKPMRIRVRVKPNPPYDPRAEIAGYEAVGRAAPAAASAPAPQTSGFTPAAEPQRASAGSRPWK